MSSRVLKGGGATEARSFPWRGDVARPEAGVRAFEPRRTEAAADQAPPQQPMPPLLDLDEIRKQAFQEGLQAGRDGAEIRCSERWEKKGAELRRVIEELARFKAALRVEAEAEVVELAFAVAKRIVRREMSVDPTAVKALVASCMREFPAVGVKRIVVHPDDLAMVREAAGAGVEAVGDPGVTRGGAVLETDQGRLDATIDSQLEEIALGLADA